MEFQHAKDRILYCAKKVFYENGYNQATLRRIAESAGTKCALVNYHFKTKEHLAAYIHTSYYKTIYARLNEERYEHLNIINSLHKQILAAYIYYENIFKDENNKCFFLEVALRDSKLFIQREFLDNIFNNYIKDFDLSMTSRDYLAYYYMQSGAKRNFVRRCIQGPFDDLSITEVVHYVEAIMPRLMGVDQKTIDSYLFKADHTILEIEYSDIKYLI